MPIRTTPLVTDHYYHVFNRGVEKRATFTHINEYERFLLTLTYYKYVDTHPKLSKFLQQSTADRKRQLANKQQSVDKLVEIISYCLMPNHFHLLLKQNTANGISTYMKLVQNSYTKYFNTRHDNRVGSLFQGQFKAIHIEDEEQLLHVSRYIHLNPFTSAVVKTIKECHAYPWSSCHEFIHNVDNICTKQIVMEQFSGDTDQYTSFLNDQANYQKELENIKHMIVEK